MFLSRNWKKIFAGLPDFMPVLCSPTQARQVNMLD